MNDHGIRPRLLRAFAASAVPAAFCAVLAFLCTWIDRLTPPPGGMWLIALAAGANVAAIVFWILFPIQFLRLRRNAADLESERRLRLAEELFKKSRYSRTSDSAAPMIRASMPGAKGTGQP